MGSLRVGVEEEEGGAVGVGELPVGLNELGELVGGDEGGADVGGSGEGEGVVLGVVDSLVRVRSIASLRR